MKKGILGFLLTCVIVTSLVLVSCATSTSTSVASSTSNTTSISTSTSTLTTTSVTTAAPPSTIIISSTAATTNVTTTSTGNWWNSLGTPQYGSSLTIRSAYDPANWDPYNNQSLTTFDGAWMERLFTDDWTLNPNIWNYQIAFRPDAFVAGYVAQSWEFTSPGTFVVQIRQGIYWQNIPPANGRELTAADVAYNFGRAFGVGSGFTQGSPSLSSNTDYSTLQSVIATGPYTVTFQWSINNPEFILETLEANSGGSADIECPEAVTLYGNLNNWHNAIGTGPFILTDFVDNSEATMIKNSNYWGYDERYPKNHLPYVDTLRFLIITNNITALAAMRAGKIDVMDTVAFSDAQNMLKTNPEILQVSYPNNSAATVGPKNDVKPFSDINVREAMQMAIDLPTIAKTYYAGTASPYPSTLTSNYFPSGWGFPYSQWPAALQAQYAYNPTTAKQLLTTAGYPNGFNTDCVADIAADPGLLQIVQSYLAAIGINMSITTMDSTSWTNLVLTQHKQDAFAYRASGLYGLTYQPVRQITAMLPGNSANYLDVTDPNLTNYENQIVGSTTTAGLQQTISNLNQYIAGQHYVICLLQQSVFGIYQPWLKGYDGRYLSISGAALGPQLIGFYGARFWIDQNVKKSFGQQN